MAFCPVQRNVPILTPEQLQIFYYVSGGLLIIFGLFIGFQGRNFYFIFVFLVGFIKSFILLLYIYYYFMLDADTPVWLLTSTVSLIALLSYVVGMLGMHFIKMGAAYLTAFGLSLVSYLAALALLNYNLNSYLYLALVFLAWIPGFMIGFYIFNHSIVLSTSLMGSYCITRGVSMYIGYFPNEITVFDAVWARQ